MSMKPTEALSPGIGPRVTGFSHSSWSRCRPRAAKAILGYRPTFGCLVLLYSCRSSDWLQVGKSRLIASQKVSLSRGSSARLSLFSQVYFCV